MWAMCRHFDHPFSIEKQIKTKKEGFRVKIHSRTHEFREELCVFDCVERKILKIGLKYRVIKIKQRKKCSITKSKKTRNGK